MLIKLVVKKVSYPMINKVFSKLLCDEFDLFNFSLLIYSGRFWVYNLLKKNTKDSEQIIRRLKGESLRESFIEIYIYVYMYVEFRHRDREFTDTGSWYIS